jgi:pyridoxine 4-dehydrogenase
MPGSNGATAADAGTVDIGCRYHRQPAGLRGDAHHRSRIWGEPPDRNQARAVLWRAVELGINFIDTADAYGPKVSEELIAEAQVLLRQPKTPVRHR